MGINNPKRLCGLWLRACDLEASDLPPCIHVTMGSGCLCVLTGEMGLIGQIFKLESRVFLLVAVAERRQCQSISAMQKPKAGGFLDAGASRGEVLQDAKWGAACLGRLHLLSDSYPPTETGRSGPTLLDDHISKAWRLRP